jgi:2-polyprenyl-3-methyl-5-hydroxy-6-metoxy-1,4-benzoquinol methylase
MTTPIEQQELEFVPCDFCSSTEQMNKLSRPVGLEVGECANCGLAYVNPRPTWEAMLAHYESSYVADTAEARWDVYRRTDAPWADVRRITRCMDLRGAAVLDVGCGSGIFLHALKCAGATELVGIEPGAVAAQSARRMLPEARILEESYETAYAGEGRFDLVSAINLIEHVYSPRRLFSFVERALKPGGFLYIRTPNWGAAKKHGVNWRGLQVDYEHVYYFDRVTLGKYLNQYGMMPVATDYDAFTGGVGAARTMSLADGRSPTSHLMAETKQMLFRAPALSRMVYRILWYFRRYGNREAIKGESAHILIMLGRKAE